MKTLFLATAAAMTLGAPALADRYDGAGSLTEFVRQHFAQDHETGDGARYRPGRSHSTVILSTKNSDLARFVFDHLKNEGERGDN